MSVLIREDEVHAVAGRGYGKHVVRKSKSCYASLEDESKKNQAAWPSHNTVCCRSGVRFVPNVSIELIKVVQLVKLGQFVGYFVCAGKLDDFAILIDVVLLLHTDLASVEQVESRKLIRVCMFRFRLIFFWFVTKSA